MPTSRHPTPPPLPGKSWNLPSSRGEQHLSKVEAHSTTSGPEACFYHLSYSPRSPTANSNTAPRSWLAGRAVRLLLGEGWPLSKVHLPGHRLGDGPRAHWHLDPFLPLLSPGIRQHVVLVRVQLVGVMELHGSDQVCPKHLDRESKGSLTLGICILLQSTGSCRVTMVLPCNQVTVSTENQSDLLRKPLGLPIPWAVLRMGAAAAQRPHSLPGSARRPRLHQQRHKSLSVLPGKLLRDSQVSKQAAEDACLKTPGGSHSTQGQLPGKC